MKILVSDQLPEQPEKSKEVSANPDDLQKVLAQYTEPAKNDTPTGQPEQPVNWKGNPDYYQSGSKAGQKKPGRDAKPKVNFVPNTTASEISGELISGALFLTMLDLVFPNIIAFLNNQASKRKVKADDLQLTKKQLDQLEPVANKVIGQLKLSANPTTVLIISMGGLYAMNYAALKMAAPPVPKPSPKQ